jgi:hypothetical protein
MRLLTAALTLAVLALAACGPRTEMAPGEAVSFATYHHIGIPAFTDSTGRGQEIADALDARFQQGLYESVDQKALAEVLKQYKADRDMGFGVEALEAIRHQTGVDALLLGRIVPDWSAAVVTMVEMSTGGVILRSIVRPRGRNKKFNTPKEVADEFIRAYKNLR